MCAELNQRAEACTSGYSVTGDFLKFIYSAPNTKNHQNIRPRCLVHEFSFTDFFNDINEAGTLKKNYLWLLSFYMAVATYCYYEKERIVSYNYIVQLYRTFLRGSVKVSLL